ncbi:hypothetical protein DER44DRAFT_816379 [Fusarium oxysporum]|nr:hypothetical protein DER44DRAFT_816379 [Fusarium oxysporum]
MTILDDPTGYTVGWIAALPIERAAATALLDDLHEAPKGFVQHQSDTNSYTWGQIGQHNIVIASLPAGVYGTTSAAATALNLLSSLPQIRIGLLVGIGSAIARPDQDWDIRLGDIVVSQPDGSTGGVIQYDLGKAKSNQAWERKGSLNKPPPILLNALSNLQAQHEITPSIVPDLLQAMWAANPQMTKPRNKFPAFIHQGFENDRLFKTEHDHAGGSTCVNCNASWEVKRDQRDTTDPEVHYGIIASGNTLVKDAATRNKIAELAGEDCVCLEMEAAGIMDRFPCLVIRGICDYADSHKNDRWQRYASATAAAYAKELLGYVPVSQLQASQRAVDMLGSIREAITDVQGEVQGIHTMVRNFDQREVLARLEEQVAAGASFDSHDEQHNSKCLPNTRVELLQQISEWTNNPNAEAVFWLNGMAGTGKSTISRTVAESLARETRLSASFFFKRGEADRGTTAKFFATIAADLTRKDPIIARHVTGIVENDPAIFRKAMREQFDKLILQPLSMVHREEPAVVIVDALDECDKENDIKVDDSPLLRPELPIRLGFKAVDGKYQSLVLHDIPKLVLEHDIALFLENELARIRDEYNASVANDRQLAGDWPGKSNIRILVKMAIPLFIFATTVCRFIADRRLGTPNKQMKKILLPRTRSQLSQLGATYLPVLDNLIVDASVEQRAEILEQFRYVVGSIIVLANPLSTSALALLLDRPRDDIDGSLDMLHSIFHVPSSVYEPVRLLHLSFRDFLLRKTAENAFWVDEEQTHRAMASNCLRVMECLREDICELKAPGTLRSAVNLQKIHTHLAPEVRYACQYWVYHMQGAGNHDDDCHRVYDFLKRHFLHWIEALSLIGRARETLHLIKKLQSLHKLSDFLDDAEHFILANTPAIERTPLQLYSSVLTFAPENSKVRTTFKDQLAPWILLEPQVESNWSQMLQTLEGHSDDVTLVTFSPDSTLIVSAARDKTVRVWRAETGESIQTLKGCSGSNYISSLAFSHDGTLIASASWDRTAGKPLSHDDVPDQFRRLVKEDERQWEEREQKERERTQGRKRRRRGSDGSSAGPTVVHYHQGSSDGPPTPKMIFPTSPLLRSDLPREEGVRAYSVWQRSQVSTEEQKNHYTSAEELTLMHFLDLGILASNPERMFMFYTKNAIPKDGNHSIQFNISQPTSTFCQAANRICRLGQGVS